MTAGPLCSAGASSARRLRARAASSRWQRGERLEQVPVGANELAEVVALTERDLLQERRLDSLPALQKAMEESPGRRVLDLQAISSLEAIHELRGPEEVLRPGLRSIADRARSTGVPIERLVEVVHAVHSVEALHPEVHILPAGQPARPARVHTFAVEHNAGIAVDLAGQDVFEVHESGAERTIEALELLAGGVVNDAWGAVRGAVGEGERSQDLRGGGLQEVIGVEHGNAPAPRSAQAHVAGVARPRPPPASEHTADL